MSEAENKNKPRTVKKRVLAGTNPEGHKYFKVIEVPVLRTGETPPPPPNFTPEERVTTSDEDHPPILTGAQGYAQARESKED